MKVFLDAGAHDSCSARLFRHEQDPNNEFLIYSFEIEPDFVDNFWDIPNLVFINKAVWIEDCKISFYRDIFDSRKAGGSLLKEKISGKIDREHPIMVEALDFSKWVRENLSKDDHIILKMDIEGAEYKVLNKMIREGTFNYIDKLLIEWHWYKVGVSRKQHNKLVSKINIPIEEWAGVERAVKILGNNYVKRAQTP